MVKQFISLIPYLTDERGHGYIYHQHVEQAVTTHLGCMFQAYVLETCQISTLPRTWHRFFRSRSLLNRLKDFGSLFSRREEAERIFFLESFNTVDLCALVIAALFFLQKKDQLWMLYRYGFPQLRWGKIHLFLSKILQWRVQGRFRVLTDSELIQRDLEQKLKLDVMLVPIPHATKVMARSSEVGKERSIFWWPGEPRIAKGLREIQYLSTIEDPRAQEMQLVCSSTAPALGSKCEIERIAPTLTREEYMHWLGNSDVILLPYDPQVYAYGTSGILVEAIVAGKVPVVKEGSWLSFQLLKYELSELILDWTQPYLISKILALSEDVSVRKKLAVMQQEFSKFHSLGTFGHMLTTGLLKEQASHNS